MINPSLNAVKKELFTLSQKDIIELCLRLARFRKENKELVCYLLFNSASDDLLDTLKNDIDLEFDYMSSNYFQAKKTLRKILGNITKYTRFNPLKSFEADLRMHFCSCFLESGINPHSHPVLENMYLRQLKSSLKAINTLHEDLQFDYREEYNRLKKGFVIP